MGKRANPFYETGATGRRARPCHLAGVCAKALLPALAALLAMAAPAERIAPPRLPPSPYLDTEVSTNIALAAWDASHTFSVTLSLEAGASNCVEVAAGHDAAPADGVLSPAEASLRFGWDGGRWFLSAPGLTNRVEMAPASAEARKTLKLGIGVRLDGSMRSISLLDGGTPILPDPSGLSLPSAGSWDMLRVTARGCAGPQEGIEARTSPDGTRLILR